LKSSFCPDQRRPISGIEDIVMFGFIIQSHLVQLGPSVSVIASAWGILIRVTPQPGNNRNGIRRRRRGISLFPRRKRKTGPSLSHLAPVPRSVAVQELADSSVSIVTRPHGVKRKRCPDGSSLATVDSLAKRVKSYYDADLEAIQKKYNPDGSLTRSQLDQMIIQQQQKVRFLEEKQGLAELSVLLDSTDLLLTATQARAESLPSLYDDSTLGLNPLQPPVSTDSFIQDYSFYDSSFTPATSCQCPTTTLFPNESLTTLATRLDFVDTFDWYGNSKSLCLSHYSQRLCHKNWGEITWL
jgi:hypothetical protein